MEVHREHGVVASAVVGFHVCLAEAVRPGKGWVQGSGVGQGVASLKRVLRIPASKIEIRTRMILK